MRGLSSGERKFATVLFADIVNSSRLVAGADPEEANNKLLPWLEAMIEVIDSYGGTVTQLLGDGVMALFGAPTAQEHHAVRACLAAQEIQRRCAKGGQQGPQWVPSPVQLRVGMSSGYIVTQPIKSSVVTEYRAVGEPVHLAARAEQSADPGQVLLTEETYNLVAGQVVVHPGRDLRLSETARVVKTFALDDVTITKRRMPPLETKAKSAFVGREADLDALHKSLAQTRVGNGGAFILVGDAGVGKSRLVAEYLEGIASDVGLILKADLEPTGVPRFDEPIAHMVRSLLNLDAKAQMPELEVTISERLQELGHHSPHAKAAVLEVLGLTPEEPDWSGIDPQERLRLTLTTIAEIVRAVGRGKPLVLVLEDFHWATSDIQHLAGEIAARLQGTQVQFLLTSRTHHEKSWIDWPRRVERKIGTLAPADVTRFLADLLEDSSDLEALTQLLIEKTGGNPFFIEECVRSLAGQGILEGKAGRYRLAVPCEEIVIPFTVHGVLAERIDGLPDNERQTLLRAAIIGKNHINVTLLERLQPGDSGNLADCLARLEEQGFLQCTRVMPSLDYSFRHTLHHDVAYTTLLRSDRVRLHHAVMGVIRSLPSHALPTKIELLAHHAFHAEAWQHAAAYYRRAGGKAQAASRNSEAALHLGKALQALEQLPATPRNIRRSVDIRLELVRSLFTLGRTEDVHQILEVSVAAAESLNDELRLGRAFSAKMLGYWIDGDLEKAIKVGRRAHEVAKRLNDLQLEIQVGTRLGSLYIDHGDYEAACTLLREVIDRIPATSAQELFGCLGIAAVGCRASLARSLGELGRFREALQIGDEAVELADEMGHSFSNVYANLFVCSALFRKGDFAFSVPLLERAHESCQATHSRLLLPLSAASLGYAFVRSGRVEDGLDLLKGAVSLANEHEVTIQLSQQTAWLAEAYLRAGEPEEAAKQAARAIEIAKENGEKGDEAWAHWASGEALCAARRGSPRKATAAYRKALSIAEACNMRPLIGHCLVALGRLEVLAGAAPKATKMIDKACELFEALGMAAEAARARACLPADEESQAANAG